MTPTVPGTRRSRGVGDDDSARNRIRAYRIAAGLTQQQLASAASISIGVVRDLEQGRTARLRPGSADALIRAFGFAGRQAREFTSAVLGNTVLSSTAAVIGQSAGLWLSVLGPLAAGRDGAPAQLGSPMQRAVLALLALSPDRLVHREALIDALWGADPPASAVNQVQAHVGRIRWLLDPDRPRQDPQRLLESTGTSYRLRVTAEHLDLLAFHDLVSRAEAARSLRDTVAACGLYQQALQLWRGDPLADVDRLRRHPAVIGLRRQWSDVIVAYAEAACDARLYSRVLPYLRRLTLNEPLHERAHALLMIALAGSGRQAAALEMFEDMRRRLDEQLGVRPCTQLADAHRRVLRQQVAAGRTAAPEGTPVIRPIQAVGTAPIVPRQLPSPTPHFAGRSGELTALAKLMDRAARKKVAAAFAIGGTVGVGKSALGLHWAHLVADRFPDGQLYMNLRGFDPSDVPVTPAEALCGLFDALQVPNEHIPASLEGQASLYRSVLAGKRMLVVLDNARGSEQVRPLLPGCPGCLVLVTSRSRLTGLVAVDGAQPVMLDELGENEARELLASRLGPDRVAAEPDATRDLVRLCARLPLALAIIAARAAVRPYLSLRMLADELRDPSTRLDALETEEAAVCVRAAFSWSFKQLSAVAARMFVLLGAHPGPDISVPAAASLAGVPDRAARGALDQLVHAGLVAEHACGRYAFHDLLRAYAAEQARGGKATRRGAPPLMR
jgi:DNA-binding SARP family transcriptional activator/transcriptional regulator with XRE-family HTH domain